jgi:hypothetical protein
MKESEWVLHASSSFRRTQEMKMNKNMIYSQMHVASLILDYQSNHLFFPNTICVSVSPPSR